MKSNIYPGINPKTQSKLDNLPDDEKTIIKKISNEWYITIIGNEIIIGPNCTYRFLLIKPTEDYKTMFNLEREIVTILSPYDNFEPRTFDAIDYVIKRYQQLRLERICSIIISKDILIESKLRDLLKSDPESQIVIPFSYKELLGHIDSYFLRNRFKNHFYTRDLFAFEAPLKKDLFFFGRNDLVYNIASRHKTNENSGLFGLRKTGKTSVIFGVERVLSRINAKSTFVDCQNPAFHKRRWNQALYYIIYEIKKQLDLKIIIKNEEIYTEKDAPIIFEDEICKIHNKLGNNNILIIFDEIENITFSVSPSEHWASGIDFIFFWQTLRSLFQKLDNVFSYLIVGTNPICIETPTIKGKDNPIFNQVPYEYIKGFDVPQTKEMVMRLGRIMGLIFDEIIFGKLTEDFGGHAFLIRHVCSVINRLAPSTRPTPINRTCYEKAKEIFNRDYNSYIEMILNVLKEFFDDEYEMLKYLADGDINTFNEFAQLSPYYTNHLLGYGIIEKSTDGYAFKIEAVKQYLLKTQKYKRLNLSFEEKLKEISERRNSLEPKLRNIVRNQLKAFYGINSAKEKVLNILGETRKSDYFAFSYEEIFKGTGLKIYFDELRKIIISNWDCFKNIFLQGKEDFDSKMQAINKYRCDAHATNIEIENMEYFRACISSIEKSVKDFLD